MIVSAIWNKRTILEKLFIAIIVVLLGYLIFISFQKYKYFSSLETKYETIKDSINTAQKRQKTLTNDLKTTTNKSIISTKKINSKLVEDEKKLNSSTVTDNELNEFLAKYGE